jgi:hypothetical protein
MQSLVQQVTNAVLAAMPKPPGSEFEILKLTLLQSNEDRKAIQADRESNQKTMIDTIAQAFRSASASQETISKVLGESKNEMMGLMKSMAEKSETTMMTVVQMLMDTFQRGIELGGGTEKAPKSDLAEMVSAAADAFKEAMIARRGVDSKTIQQAVQAGLKGVAPKAPVAANPVPLPPKIAEAGRADDGGGAEDSGAEDTGAEVEVSPADTLKADTALRVIITAVKTKPETTAMMKTVITSIPGEILQETMQGNAGTQPIFDWLQGCGSDELVAELVGLFADPANVEWLRQAFAKEGKAGAA